MSHDQFVDAIRAWSHADSGREKLVEDYRSLLLRTADDCVLARLPGDGKRDWIVPSAAYQQLLVTRDSFWILLALQSKELSETTVARLREDQLGPGQDGHVATALLRDSRAPVAADRDRDDESTLYYVLHNYLLHQLGGSVDSRSLRLAYGFIARHVQDGQYVTWGERRADPLLANDRGAYHYWADSFRPAGRPEATPEVISYNQGLYCLALYCLEKMGLGAGPGIREAAERAYASTVNPRDGVSLPQRRGSAIVDVSALAPEALSLLLFDRSLLGTDRVRATASRLARVDHPDGSFLGFKVISDYGGGYRPSNEFIAHVGDVATGADLGNYHNGGSWFLWDQLALYAAARHGLADPAALFVQRLYSEVKHQWAVHEYISTARGRLGESEAHRSGYGWNSAVVRLLPE